MKSIILWRIIENNRTTLSVFWTNLTLSITGDEKENNYYLIFVDFITSQTTWWFIRLSAYSNQTTNKVGITFSWIYYLVNGYISLSLHFFYWARSNVEVGESRPNDLKISWLDLTGAANVENFPRILFDLLAWPWPPQAHDK